MRQFPHRPPPMALRLAGAVAVWLAIGAAGRSAEEFSGFSEPFRTIDLSCPEAGVVSAILVREGDAVEPGQTLGMLDNSVLEQSLRIAEIRAASDAAVRTAEAKVEMSRSRLAKIEKLAEGKSAGSDELERARLDLVIAEADLALAGENRRADAIEVEQIKAQIQRRTFISPVRGIVDRIHADVGEGIEARGAAVMKIVETDLLNIILYLPVEDAVRFHPGGLARVAQKDGGGEATALVRHVSPVVDAASGTVRIKIELDNRAGKFRSGVRFSAWPQEKAN